MMTLAEWYYRYTTETPVVGKRVTVEIPLDCGPSAHAALYRLSNYRVDTVIVAARIITLTCTGS